MKSGPVARRFQLVARRCDARIREVGLVLALGYREYASKYDGWPHYGDVPISARRFVVLFNLVVADAYELNDSRELSRTKCLEALAEALEDDQYAFGLAMRDDGIDDPFTE